MTSRWVLVLMLGAFGCDQATEIPERRDAATAEGDALAATCKMPTDTTIILDRDGAILETWTFRAAEVATAALPEDPAFLAYRAAIERDGANVVRPVADPPTIRTEAEAAMWANEYFNNDLVFSGAVGSIEPISCLDALLFSRQAGRFSQVDKPTEFIASVLRRESSAGPDVAVVFGAGSDTFVPKDVYGFDVVQGYLADGWRYWYAIHNHPVQKNGELLALGVPALSTNDVLLSRNLAADMSLESVRVTNGFYTFNASVAELDELRAE
jgi:hypothetical protein